MSRGRMFRSARLFFSSVVLSSQHGYSCFLFDTSYHTLIIAWLGDTGSGSPFVTARGWFVVNHKSGVARGESLDLVGQYRSKLLSLPYFCPSNKYVS